MTGYPHHHNSNTPFAAVVPGGYPPPHKTEQTYPPPPHATYPAQPSTYPPPTQSGSSTPKHSVYPQAGAASSSPSPFAAVVPSPAVFPPETDPNAVACFHAADTNGEGLIDDAELQKGLSLYHHTFSIGTVRLLMFIYTNFSVTKIGPTEFVALYDSLKSWKAIFEKFDSDRSGKIDVAELGNALESLGFAVPPPVLELLVAKYGCGCEGDKGIEYDNFIECCLIVKGLSDKFVEKDTSFSGSITLTIEGFLLIILPLMTVAEPTDPPPFASKPPQTAPQPTYPPPSQSHSPYPQSSTPTYPPPSPYPQSSTPTYPPPSPYPQSSTPTYPPPPQRQTSIPNSSAYPPSQSPFAAVVPSPVVFPPGTDPNAIACFQLADQSGEGLIDDHELQKGLSLYLHTFNIRTVRLLMFVYTNFSTTTKIGPVEFVTVYNSLKTWKATFEKFDSDRSGKIDIAELGNALVELGFIVPSLVLKLLISKFGCGAENDKGIEYDNFIQCCLIVKGLSDKFKEKDTTLSGSITLTIEAFLLTILPFIQTEEPTDSAPPQAQSHYPPSSTPSYPPQAQSHYPPSSTPSYPPQAQSHYPPSSTPSYPPQAQSHYPPPSTPSYPPQAQSHYPPSSTPSYPPQAQSSYPPSYPPQSQSHYPPSSTPSYPPQAQSPYPPSSPSYPPQQQSHYPPSYPPQSQSPYPPSSTPSYPPQSQYPYPPSYPPSAKPSSSPFAAVVPSPVVFPPGTDANAVACFQLADQNGEGLIDDVELQKGLSLYHHTFNIHTVRLLLFIHTNFSTAKKIGPTEFVTLYNSLKGWKAIFEKFDSDHSGKIDIAELGNALVELGFIVPSLVLKLLITKYGCGAENDKGIEYDNFVECCLIVKGLSDKFKEKDTAFCGSITLTIEAFLLTILPFIFPAEPTDSAPQPPKTKPQESFPFPPQPHSSYPPSHFPQNSAYPPQNTYPPSPQAYSPYPPKSSTPPYPPPLQTVKTSTSSSAYPPSPFAAVVPSPVVFPAGTDANAVACFQVADQNGEGLIDDFELQKGLSLYHHTFNIHTVRLLMFVYTNFSTVRKIGPTDFVTLYNNLKTWKVAFEKYDSDRSNKIEVGELGNAFISLGFAVPPQVLELLVAKYGCDGDQGIEYDNFIECCLIVKGLSDKFKDKDTALCGSITLTIEAFLLTILPFIFPAEPNDPPPASSQPPKAPPQAKSPYPPPSNSGRSTPKSSAYPPPGSSPSPFAAVVPSPAVFPPGTDPNAVACFQVGDQSGEGMIDDVELQKGLSLYHHTFSIHTVRLLVFVYTNFSPVRKIGPTEFVTLYDSLRIWKVTFEKFDIDRSGKIDVGELGNALVSLGFAVPPPVLELLVEKYGCGSESEKGIEYDNFIECCLIAKGLSAKFQEKDTKGDGTAVSFDYESFLLTLLPFVTV